jgi:hypothetical protein
MWGIEPAAQVDPLNIFQSVRRQVRSCGSALQALLNPAVVFAYGCVLFCIYSSAAGNLPPLPGHNPDLLSCLFIGLNQDLFVIITMCAMRFLMIALLTGWRVVAKEMLCWLLLEAACSNMV